MKTLRKKPARKARPTLLNGQFLRHGAATRMLGHANTWFKKMPTRRANEQYWNEAQFNKLCAAAAGQSYSRGPLPWRLLAYMLDASPEVDIIRRLVGKRLMDPGRIEAGQKELDRMLMTLWRAGYVTLEPQPPTAEAETGRRPSAPRPRKKPRPQRGWTSRFGFRPRSQSPRTASRRPYKPMLARPTENLAKLLLFRGINPLYAVFLVNQLGIADRNERIQAMESVLELPRLGGPFRPRAAAGRTAARPAGHDAARRATAATRAGHAGGAFADAADRRGRRDRRRFDDERARSGC